MFVESCELCLCFGCAFTPKCCCICCTTTTLLSVLIICLIVFLAIIPNMAQEATDSATMTILSMHLSNVTNNSVYMSVSMQLSNAGSVDATIKSAEAHGYFENPSNNSDELLYVGRMTLPDINVKANEGATFDVNAPLMVDNVTNFRV